MRFVVPLALTVHALKGKRQSAILLAEVPVDFEHHIIHTSYDKLHSSWPDSRISSAIHETVRIFDASTRRMFQGTHAGKQWNCQQYSSGNGAVK